MNNPEIILFEDDENKISACEFVNSWQIREFTKDKHSIGGWYCDRAFSLDKSYIKMLSEIQK